MKDLTAHARHAFIKIMGMLSSFSISPFFVHQIGLNCQGGEGGIKHYVQKVMKYKHKFLVTNPASGLFGNQFKFYAHSSIPGSQRTRRLLLETPTTCVPMPVKKLLLEGFPLTALKNLDSNVPGLLL
jgi:hypothetical protein